MPIFPAGYPEKTSNSDDDKFLISDSIDSNKIKGTKWSTIKSSIKSYVEGFTDWITTSMLKNDSVNTPKIADGAVTPDKVDNSSFVDTVDANGWKRSLRPDGRIEYTKSVNITTPSLATGTTSSVSVGNAPVGVNPSNCYSVQYSTTMGSAAPPQALVHRLNVTNSAGGALSVGFTNPYASTTGGTSVTVRMVIVN